MAEEVVRIPQHRHCIRCGKAFVGEGGYCTDLCRDTKQAELKASKRKLLAMWGISALIVIAAIVLTVL
ncbi:MAG: DUF2116 family Zn-ribbon domain-containing protein [Thermoplasmatales archaeon]|nr:DUF2116 family Zn-ribbon domain-containing protein [Thermoplasmatales archaeon]